MSSSPVRFRFISTNDVYELDNWPFAKSCIRAHRLPEEEGRTVVVLPGDFLAPSLLSSLDKGEGMTDCMNLVGFDFVCFGNHEADIAVSDLWDRIRQSTFRWINSNMPDFPGFEDHEDHPDIASKMSRYYVVEHGGKKVALLGLLTPQQDLYKDGAFDGAIETATPILDTALQLHAELENAVDLVVPLTHQLMWEDREFCRHPGQGDRFPLILGAHDHIPFDEVVNGCHVIKVGQDASHMAICDVIFREGQAKPDVIVETVDVKHYAPDAAIQAAVRRHKTILDELREAYLWKIPEHYVGCLTSKGVRQKQTTCGAHLMSAVRRAFLADAAFYQGGGIRRNMDYPADKTHFSYLDLREELAFEDDMVLIPMTGKEFADTIEYSRRFAGERDFGGFFQCDRGVKTDPETGKLTHISFEPIEYDRSYWIAAPINPVEGLENNLPLMEWASKNSHKIPTRENVWPGRKNTKASIVANQAASQVKRVWHHMHDWSKVPKNEKSVMGPEEVRTAVRAILGYVPVNDLVLHNIMRWGDRNATGAISAMDFLQCKLRAMVCHGKHGNALWYQNLKEDTFLDPDIHVKPLCYRVFSGQDTRDGVPAELATMVDAVVGSMDIDLDGKLSRMDIMRWQQDRNVNRRISI